MIAHLSGTIIAKNEKSIIVDVGGVGYEVFIATPYLTTITTEQTYSCFIYTAVREDAISLYGFDTLKELALFKQLLTVSRIGPKSALDIMGAGAKRVQKAIVEKNLDFLGSIPGIGKKTAERILVELKNKITSDGILETITASSSVSADVIDALLRLGYQRHHVTRILQNLPAGIAKEEDIITFFLKSV